MHSTLSANTRHLGVCPKAVHCAKSLECVRMNIRNNMVVRYTRVRLYCLNELLMDFDGLKWVSESSAAITPRYNRE